MSEVHDTADREASLLDLAEAALDGVTPGPWIHHLAPSRDGSETPEQYVANTLRGDGAQLHVLTVPSDDPNFAYLIPAITGDGPGSGTNADFIAAARTLMPMLVGRLAVIRAAYVEYQAALDRREHGGVAAGHFIDAVGEVLR